MSLELEDLRERTLANNLVWLRSFGCDVRREGNVVYVDNPEATDYCALLLFAGPEEVVRGFLHVRERRALTRSPAERLRR